MHPLEPRVEVRVRFAAHPDQAIFHLRPGPRVLAHHQRSDVQDHALPGGVHRFDHPLRVGKPARVEVVIALIIERIAGLTRHVPAGIDLDCGCAKRSGPAGVVTDLRLVNLVGVRVPGVPHRVQCPLAHRASLEAARRVHRRAVALERLEPGQVRVRVDVNGVLEHQGGRATGRGSVQGHAHITVGDAGRFAAVGGVVGRTLEAGN